MARASTVIGLTMLGATGVGAATIPFMGSSSGAHGAAGLRCAAHQFPTVQACQAAGHAACRPDGTHFVPANCSTGTGTSGSRWYNSHPIYWFGGGGRTTTSHGGGTPQTLTTTTRPGTGGTTTTTGGGTSSRGGFGSSSTSHGVSGSS
jgi:hypothetical protein